MLPCTHTLAHPYTGLVHLVSVLQRPRVAVPELNNTALALGGTPHTHIHTHHQHQHQHQSIAAHITTFCVVGILACTLADTHTHTHTHTPPGTAHTPLHSVRIGPPTAPSQQSMCNGGEGGGGAGLGVRVFVRVRVGDEVQARVYQGCGWVSGLAALRLFE